MTGKYAPLARHLSAAAADGEHSVTLTFGEIDRLVGRLPPTARTGRTWWANNSNTQARAWGDAGWHVGSVDLDLGRVRFEPGEVGGSYAARGYQPRTERSDRLDVAELRPTQEIVEAAIRFEWLDAGEVCLDGQGKPKFSRLPARPGIYRLLLEGRPEQQRPALYVGESDNLARRASNYRNPGPRQQTSLRINERLRTHLSAGGSAQLWVATDVAMTTGGVEEPLDLATKAARLLAENAALVPAQRSGHFDIENLG